VSSSLSYLSNSFVVPPSCRPSVRRYNGQRSEDDITTKYYDIFKQNEDLAKLINDPEAQEKHIMENLDNLQSHVNTMINNDGKGGYPEAKTRAGRSIKSIIQRFTGKEGRIRYNLMGKRVDFSARSVISPDANLKISELGVPREIAMNLTFPEIVNKYNRERLITLRLEMVMIVYPGALSYC
jgi:DNA-directed RNA polymerase II subunit RPB1